MYVRHTPHELKGELALCIVRTGFTSELKCIFRIFCLNKGQNHGAGGIRKTYLLLPLLQPLTSVLIPPSNCLNFTFSLQKLGFKPIAIQDSWYLHLLFKHMCRTDRQLQQHGKNCSNNKNAVLVLFSLRTTVKNVSFLMIRMHQ